MRAILWSFVVIPTISWAFGIACADPAKNVVDKLVGIDQADPIITINRILAMHASLVDLRVLTNYGRKIAKADLLPLSNSKDNSIKKLNLLGLDLTDEAIEPIRDLNLKMLQLDANKLRDLHALAKMQTLEELYVGTNPLCSAAYQRISELHKLKKLNLNSTPIRDSDLKKIYALHNLAWINLRDCNLSYEALKTLKSKLPACDITAGPDMVLDDRMLRKFQDGVSDRRFLETIPAIGSQISRWQKKTPPDYRSIASSYVLLAQCQNAKGHLNAAIASCLSAISMFEKYDAASLRSPTDYFEIATRFLEQNGRIEAAIQARKTRHKVVDPRYTINNKWLRARAESFTALSHDYEKIGDFANAAKASEDAASIFAQIGHERRFSPDH